MQKLSAAVFLLTVFLLLLTIHTGYAQQSRYAPVFEDDKVDQLPVFPAGSDSLQRFYFLHNNCLKSILKTASQHGDTGKYLRVYFSFEIDKYGFINRPAFIRVAATRYPESKTAKSILYLTDNDHFLDNCIKTMFLKMSRWKPALRNGIAVACRLTDYFQFYILPSNK